MTHKTSNPYKVMAEEALRKLEDQLKCAICLDTYTDPKLLQCFHVFCRQCLVKLVVRDPEGQLSLTCPACRQATPIPTNGVTGFPSVVHINHLLEILEEHKKAKDTAASQEGAKSVVTHPIPPRKVIANCFEHTDKERDLYCETCEDLICLKCAIKGGKHQNHDYHLLDEAFEKYKGEVGPSLELMGRKLMAVKEALTQLDKRCEEISNQRVAIKDEITQRKLKRLAVQRDKMETIHAQLSSCLDFVRESLKTDSHGEVLMMKTNIVNQVKELTSPFQAGVLEPNTEADVEFSQDKDTISEVQNYGQVSIPDPLRYQATGKGSQVTKVREKSTAVVKTGGNEIHALSLAGKCLCKINPLHMQQPVQIKVPSPLTCL